ncbi:MAG TPA: hypothetical protein VFY16_13060 [Gemmatimonadaceae bacterium]|nr:hypothetical protein [Gemmatimonadaceae bacterium]
MDEKRREPEQDEKRAAPSAPAAGAAAGAVGGAAAAATAGTLIAGPLGTIVGALIGAVGGGWAGFGAGEAAQLSDVDEARFRSHFEGDPDRPAELGFERARSAYHLGLLAARNPDYAGRSFDEVEADLRRGWIADVEREHGGWEQMRRYARAGYDTTRAREHAGAEPTPAAATPAVDPTIGFGPHHAAPYNDPLPHVPPDSAMAAESSTIPDPGANTDEGDASSADWIRDFGPRRDEDEDVERRF